MKKLQPYIFPGILLLLCGVYAAIHHFILDDAFITFRYAHHLAMGEGPVWNPGERVEGYTNFLWMVLLAGVHKLGGDPVPLSQILGILFYLMNLWMIFLNARIWLQSQRTALLVMLLSGMCFTMAAFATGGLETSMYGFLWSLSLFIYLKIREATHPPLRWLIGLGTVLALAQLTRPDAILLILPLGGLLLFRAIREKRSWLKNTLALAIPVFLVNGGHQLWRVLYYNEWFPNTFYIKGTSNPKEGLFFLGLFLLLYGFPLLVIWLLPRLKQLKAAWDSTDLERTLLILPWLGYLVLIGGDFMEFRMLVPVIPLLYISAAAWVSRLWPGKKALLIWALCFLAMGLLPPFLFRETFPGGHTLTVYALKRETSEPEQGLVAVGKQLGDLFGRDADLHIATGTAGAIPYYMEAFTTDLLGLNDKWVARYGEIAENALPGHRRYAPTSYLLERGVNLQLSRWIAPWSPEELIAFQGSWPGGDAALWYHFGVADTATLPPETRLLLIPLSGGNFLHLLYFTPHPRVENAIQKHSLTVLTLVPDS